MKMPNTMLTIRIRADMRFKVCSTLLNHSLPARDALTRVFQGMPVCQVMYKETLTPALRILQLSVSTVGETHGAAVLILALMGGARILACRRRRQYP